MGRYFIVASLCGLVLGLAIPQFLPFVLGGIALGALPTILTALQNRARVRDKPLPPRTGEPLPRSRWRSGWAIALMSVGAIAALSSLLVSFASFEVGLGGEDLMAPMPRLAEPPLAVVMPATYRGEGHYYDDPERLEIVDRLEISSVALEQMASDLRSEFSPTVGGLSPDLVAGALAPDEDLVIQLEAEGWRFAERSTIGNTFERHRRISLDADTFPAETGNSIDLPAMLDDSSTGDSPLEIDLNPESRFVLVGPARTFGSSYPEGTRADHPASGEEEIAIPVSSNDAIEVEVRSPFFRGWLLGGFVDLTLTDAVTYLVGLLVTAIIAAASKSLRNRLKQAIRLLRTPQPSG